MVTPGATVKRTRQAERLDELELWRSATNAWKRLLKGGEKNLANADLTLAEFRILRMLTESGTLPMNRLSHETLLSQPSITGLIDKLEERELVERVRNNADRREVLIAITPKGKGALARGEELHKQFVRRVFSVLANEEMVELNALLKKVADMSDPLPPGAEKT